jgi:hypothetical protein
LMVAACDRVFRLADSHRFTALPADVNGEARP